MCQSIQTNREKVRKNCQSKVVSQQEALILPAPNGTDESKMTLQTNLLSNKTKMQSSYVIFYLTLILVTSQLLTIVMALHLPKAYGSSRLMRRQDDGDSDGEDELDLGASAPGYQNQNEGQNGDGYDDNEPDGAYDETPREEEGQADLERFFDDHLGASEKDGMDKENLPSNIVPIAIPLINPIHLNRTPNYPEASASSYQPLVTPITQSIKQPHHPQQPLGQPTDIETSYIKLPNNKLIITRQSITRGPIYKGGIDLPEIPSIPENYFSQNEAAPVESQPRLPERDDNLNAKGSEIVATEDDDFDRVYVTKLNNKPFKIDALGGYDPEEDFRDASRDLEESSTRSNSKGERPKNKSQRQDENEEEPQKDINFNDPETEVLFNDASETDEVTFGPNDEHDLEHEMRAQSYDQPGKPTKFKSQSDHEDSTEYDPNASVERQKVKEPEGSWVNDGVEDMEIPSQSHQDAVLAKAARQEELARRAAEAEEEAAAEAQPNQDEDSPEGQRMANADYMKDDLPAMDDEYSPGYDS